jgi:hypothetical protein
LHTSYAHPTGWIDVVLCGGVNEMVGIGFGRATIMMSSTPFWLAKTGGS